MKNALKEFKEFAVRGNVVDMAVGVVVGTAFGRIVTSVVNDIVMPPIGYFTGGVDYSDLEWTLRAATEEAPAMAIRYGAFLTTVIDFLIIAFAVFVTIKQINRFKKKEEKKEEKKPAKPSEEVLLLREIRDAVSGSSRSAKNRS